MPTVRLGDRVFDARPDRVDFRDLPYRPPLRSLPPEWPSPADLAQFLPEYEHANLVLDQGTEGACTGFGLAALINYLLFRRSLQDESTPAKVSPRMLYQLARTYDEWAGEDYEGSSCRGAMKGWHRHGVTSESLWPYRVRGKVRFVKPRRGWQQDAAKRPLGAYYRIDKVSLSDMQAAIHEVGAIYCSAGVHEGWFLESQGRLTPIPLSPKKAGGHAFALVGYTADGFIVQNSWGPSWGFHGFAILTYEDWVKNGADSWAAVLGAPMRVAVPRTRTSAHVADNASGRAAWFWERDRASSDFAYSNPKVSPLDEEAARLHSVVFANEGRPINHLIDCEDAAAAVEEVTLTLPSVALKKAKRTSQPPRLAIYAHGGLNDEAASIRRTQVLAPYFRQNGIYPLFISWKTGLVDSILGIIQDWFAEIVAPLGELAAGWLEDLGEQVAEARDRSIEAACQKLLVKPVWTQMKQNAEAAGASGGGLGLIARNLVKLAEAHPKLEVHLVGHSAGAILLGHLLKQMQRSGSKATSLSLYAPACSVDFANHFYGSAVRRGVLDKRSIFLDVLSDDRERADSVGPYGKSLLYLVSRALEVAHKTPLLGMAAALDPARERVDQWDPASRVGVAAWRSFAGSAVGLRIHDHTRANVPTGQGTIPLAHGSFDNDVDVVTATLTRIRGARLLAAVENLHGF